MRLEGPTLSKIGGYGPPLHSFLIVLLAVATVAAQDFQIRTRVDLVVVPVTVKASGDQLVTGLTKDDVRVFEDGAEQAITNFTADPVPISAAVLLDTGLTGKSFTRIRETLPALTGAFSEFDEIAVYRFDTYVTKLADFTKDKDLVLTALTKLKDIEPSAPRVASGPFNTPGPVINGRSIAPSIDASARLPAPGAKVLHDAIFTAADDLSKRSVDRRRMVLLVSDGRARGSDHSYDQTIDRLLDSKIEVYSVGMDVAFLARRLSVLANYSKATGGDAFFLSSTDALERAYTRAAEEARNQYVLGYFSNHEVGGRLPVFRRIEVKADRPDVQVLHRKGYFQYP